MSTAADEAYLDHASRKQLLVEDIQINREDLDTIRHAEFLAGWNALFSRVKSIEVDALYERWCNLMSGAVCGIDSKSAFREGAAFALRAVASQFYRVSP